MAWKPTTPFTDAQLVAFRKAVRAYYEYQGAAGAASDLFPNWDLTDFCNTIENFADCADETSGYTIDDITEEHIMMGFEDDVPAPAVPLVPILDVTPKGHYADRSPIYGFTTSYPWVFTTPIVRDTPQQAHADAEAWAAGYRLQDPYGNMANALGATAKDGGYVGVVNYYHSNS